MKKKERERLASDLPGYENRPLDVPSLTAKGESTL